MTDLAEPPPSAASGDRAGADRPDADVVHVDVVPHTHWDREWYSPYPTFRLRLVDLVDELLPRLESDPAFTHFQLDGQMAVVDDYLGLRPDEQDRLRRLAADGRVSMGPWYVLPDEFLVSGETHVRNLQLGLRRAADFGGAMEIGYLPDMFGHIAQMPQILRQFGFSDAVVWRGVGSTITAPAFWWVAPDGSRVRAEYLPAGYGNGSELPRDPAGVREKIELFRLLQGPLVGDPVLLMAGMDHEVPPAHLSAVIAELDAAEVERAADADGATPATTYRVEICSLADHLARSSSVDLPEHHGELRSGFRANLLMGVASNRVDVKQAAARAERTLERIAEPLAALWLDRPERWRPVFDAAWLGVIHNAAHDSICACSHDEVVDAVLHRYAEATRLAQGVAERAVAAAAVRMATPGGVVLNATARTRTGVVVLDVPGPAAGEPVEHPALQVLSAVPAVEEIDGATGEEAPMRLALAALAEHPDTRRVRFEESDDGVVAHLLSAPGPDDGDALSPADALALVGQRVAAEEDLHLRLVVHRHDPVRRALALAADVPGFGWARWEPVVPRHPVSAVGDAGLTNGLVAVEADAVHGTFSIDGMAGFGRLVDEGDAGDTYNWCPVEHDVVVDEPTSVAIVVTEAGPVRGRISIEATYLLPERCRIDGQDDMTTGWAGGETYVRTGEVVQVITTTVELRADDPAVRVTTAWDQRARDHRLRAHLPLPSAAASSEAEDAYAVVERPLWAEGGPNEWGLATFPSRRFVRSGGMTVTHEGLCEYELVDLVGPDGEALEPGSDALPYGVAPPDGTTAGTLALTLVRSTGWLSRGPMPSRPQPAGPFDRLEGAQTIRPLSLRYAIQLDRTEGAMDPYALADHVWNPLRAAAAPGGGDLDDRGTLLEVTGTTDELAAGDGIEVDAVLRDPDGHLTVRAHATSGSPARLGLPGRTGEVVDLRGRPLSTFDEAVDVAGHAIVTVRID